MSDLPLRPLRALVETHRDEIKAIVARHHGRSVALFGSVARGDEQPGSDIDFLVELDPDAPPLIAAYPASGYATLPVRMRQ